MQKYIFLFLLATNICLAQSTIILPNGTVIPSFTQANRPTTDLTVGQLIYQTDGTTGLYVWNGTAWTAVSGGSGSGTITNVSANAPLSVANPTTTPTISMPQANGTTNGFLSSTDWANFNNKFTLPALNSGSLLFSNGSSITQNNGKLFWNNTDHRLGVGINNPSSTMHVEGTGGLTVSTNSSNTSSTSDWIAGNFGSKVGNRVVVGNLLNVATVGAHNSFLNNWADLAINPGGATIIGSLAGSGNRMVVAEPNGKLISQPIPAAGGTVTNVSTSAPLSVTNPTTTPTISMPQANGTTSGFLSNTDWTAFNNKFTLPSLTSGSLLFSDGTTLAQKNTKLFWNDTNDRLGIGTNNPSKTVEISGLGGLKVSSLGVGANYDWIAGDFGGTTGARVVMGRLNGTATIGAHQEALDDWANLNINPGGFTFIGSLVGTGNRMVVADPNGRLFSQPLPGGGGTVTNVTATAPLSVTNGTSTPNISMPQANGTTSGFLSSTDWATFNSKQNVLPFASEFANGILRSTDWINFNNKLSTSNLTTGSLVFGDGTTALGQNNTRLFWDNTNFRLGVGTNTPQATLQVSGSGGLRVNSTNPGSGITDWIAGNFGGTAGARVVTGNFEGKATIGAHTQGLNAWEKLVINPGGATVIGSLVGNGTRLVVANSDGELMASSSSSIITGLTNGISLVGTSGELGGLLTKDTRININDKKLRLNINSGAPQNDQVLTSIDAVGYFTSDIWQSFTSGITGALHQLIVRARTGNGISGVRSYKLTLYNGNGIAGEVLLVTEGLISNLSGDYANVTLEAYSIAYLTAGQQYTFRLQMGSQTTFAECHLCNYPGGSNQNGGNMMFTTVMRPESQRFLFDNDKLAVGNIIPTANLDINGSVRLRPNAGAGKVLTSDANGNATWQNAGASGNLALNNFALSNDGSSNGIYINNAGNVGIGSSPNPSNRLEVAGTGGAKISSTNTGSGATDWIASNVGGTTGNRVVSGLLNGNATVGAHNNALNNWANLAINPSPNHTVSVGAELGTNPIVYNTTLTGNINRNLVVNGSIRQGYYGQGVSVPANSIVVISWQHNLGYFPIVMSSLDQTGGGFMDYCNVVTQHHDANRVDFIIRNLGGNAASGALRWILVW